MTLEVDYLPFATGGAANVVTQTVYAASAFVGTGFEPGIAQSAQLNKVWRQSSMVSAAIANWISQTLNTNVLDDGNLNALIALLQSSVSLSAATRPLSLLTASTNVNVSSSQYRVLWSRTVSPAALSAQLPTLSSGAVGQSFRLGDVAGNAAAYPITVLAPSGQSIASPTGGTSSSYVIASDSQVAEFAWCGSNIWSLET